MISSLVIFISHYKYILLFFGVIIEGPILMIASGFLWRTGSFEFIPMFFAIFAGDLIGDIVWYYIGYFFAEPFIRKHGHFLALTPDNFEKAKSLFKQYHAKILLISKVTLGLGMALATLMVAGMTKIKFKTYMLLNAVGEFILVVVLLYVGYFFGHLYSYIEKGFKMAFIIGIIIIVTICVFGFTTYMKNKFKVLK